MLKKADMILLGSVVFAALILWGALFLFGSHGTAVTVKEKNEIVYEGSLGTDKTVFLTGNTVVIENGRVFVRDATCPNQICVHHRPVSKKGETILCLPHEVAVIIN